MIFYWDITQTKDMLTEGQDKIKETLSISDKISDILSEEQYHTEKNLQLQKQ